MHRPAVPCIAQQALVVLCAPTKDDQPLLASLVLPGGGGGGEGVEGRVRARLRPLHACIRRAIPPSTPRACHSVVECPLRGVGAGAPSSTSPRSQRRVPGSRRQTSLAYEWFRPAPGV